MARKKVIKLKSCEHLTSLFQGTSIMEKNGMVINLKIIVSLLFLINVWALHVSAAARRQSAMLWPCGTVPYELFNNVVGADKVMFENAAKQWEIAGVKFIPRTTETNYILVIKNDKSDHAEVGMKGTGLQFVSVSFKDVSAIIHELGHVLGLIHEHQRSNRDSFVKIIDDNINPADIVQIKPKEIDQLLTPYDYDSIMHYTANAGLTDEAIKKNLYSIEPLNLTDLGRLLVPHTQLTTLDIIGVRNLYEKKTLTVILDLEKADGEVTSEKQVSCKQIECGTSCSQQFNKGVEVVLRAAANTDSRFAGWGGGVPASSDTTNPSIGVPLFDNKTVTAKFVEKPDDDDRPPDDPDCYTWDPTAGMGRGGWVWDCKDSAKRGRLPKPIDGLCWVWDDTAGPMHKGGWVLQRCPPPADSAGLSVTGVAAYDPNDKVGSQGVGAGRYLSGEESLRYVIYFENIATASAPAHEVVISDQLDIAKLDLDTFSLGHIAFGDKLITPPASLNQFTQDVDLRPARNLIVKINASLDKTAGLLNWRFNSIDPDTGLPPEDLLAGFLPPNKNPPEGEGHVLFTVMPKQGLNTGIEIWNRARIIFDANPPIDTPQWLNTIDNTKPSSRVLLLAGTQSSTTFNVQWSGTDAGSGIRDYTVYVSDNGGPFTVWASQTSATQAAFTGVDSHTYSFFSVARDLTGNGESIKSTPDTTTQVVLNRPPVAKTKNIEVAAGNSCTVIIRPGDVDDGSFDPDGDAVGLTLAPAGPLGLGVHEVVLTASDSHGSSDSASATVTVIDQVPPTITNVSASPSIIWPPDRRMVDVLVSYDAADNCGQTISRLSVHSEDRLTASDVEIVDAHHLRLRAERRGNGGGRTYRITIFVMDGYGNSSSKEVLIRVPHDQRR
jgi:hypothetical protein